MSGWLWYGKLLQAAMNCICGVYIWSYTQKGQKLEKTIWKRKIFPSLGSSSSIWEAFEDCSDRPASPPQRQTEQILLQQPGGTLFTILTHSRVELSSLKEHFSTGQILGSCHRIWDFFLRFWASNLPLMWKESKSDQTWSLLHPQ